MRVGVIISTTSTLLQQGLGLEGICSHTRLFHLIEIQEHTNQRMYDLPNTRFSRHLILPVNLGLGKENSNATMGEIQTKIVD